MRIRHIGLLLIVLFAVPAAAQTVGEVQTVDLSDGSATVTLDLSEQDYELIVYSAHMDVADTASTYSFTVLGPNTAAKPILLETPPPVPVGDRDRLEAELREKERILARRIRETGWKPVARKVQPRQAQTRSFVFQAFGNVTTDQTVNATLVASNDVVLAYLDDSSQSQGVFTTDQIQEMIDTFEEVSYSTVIDNFGEASDVDSDGRVTFLFTHLVDQVGGVSGFYASSSVVPPNLGGDGNETDMMFIGLDGDFDFYTSLLAHEFQHLVNFNEHVLVNDGQGEESWLNEGLSHYAEDLVNGHVTGELPRLYVPYLEAPQTYSLIGPAGANNGIRGAAYLFVRTLVEDFGPSITGQLVQTGLAGTENVEDATGFAFTNLFRDHVARLFLSGTGLNIARIYNYTFSYFTDPATDKRSLPEPREVGIPTEGSPVTGTVHPLSAAFLRLMGQTSSQSVTIQADTQGDLRALLIPIPRDYHADRSLRSDYFPAIDFDSSIPGLYTTGVAVQFIGEVNDDAITQLLFQFVSTDGAGREIEFFTSELSGEFNEFILLGEDVAGTYNLEIYGGVHGESLPFIGRFPVVVLEGSGSIELPLKYFTGLTLDALFPTEFAAGSPVPFAGTADDANISEVQLQFDPLDQNDVASVRTSVRTDGTFSRGYVFEPGTEGEYSVTVFAFDSDGNATSIGSYEPITVGEPASDRAVLPVDFFKDIELDQALSTTFYAGESIALSGTMLDTDLNRVGLFLVDENGSTVLDTRATAENNRFTLEFTVPIVSQKENLEVSMFAGVLGGSLFGKGSYGAGRLLNSQPTLLILSENLPFAETSVGTSSEQNLAVDNVGTEPLTLSNFTFEGPFRAGSTTSVTIQPGERGSIGIIFEPTSPGDATGSIQFDTNDPARQVALVGLSGTATQQLVPEMRVLDQALAWGSVTVGQSGTRVVRIANIGDADLTLNDLQIDSDVFSLGSPVTSIAPGDTIEVPLIFAPDSTGTVIATLTISGNDLENPSTDLLLSGVGVLPDVPILLLGTSTIEWDEFEVGTGQVIDLLLANIGSGDLEIGSISAQPEDFQVDVTSLTIAEGDSVFLSVTFAPTEEGERIGSLTFSSNDPDAPDLEITLMGVGIVVPTGISPDFNRDGVVDFADFLEFATVFGSSQGDSKYATRYDLTQDGEINFSDFLEFATAFGTRVD